MVIPLLDGSSAIGVIDFQSDQAYEFGLDDVARERHLPSSW